MRKIPHEGKPSLSQEHGYLITLATIILGLVLAGCRQEPVGETNGITIPPPPTQTLTSPTTEIESQPKPTGTRDPTPTTKPEPSATPGCQFDYFFDPAPETCPVQAPIISAAAEQPFEGGVMIWLEATDSVYIFDKNQRWKQFEDTWSEDLLESDPAIIPPQDRYQPIRGFGKVWRDYPEVREQLGWALGPELGFDSIFQEQQVEAENPPVTFLLTFNGQVFALVHRAPTEGEWVIAASW